MTRRYSQLETRLKRICYLGHILLKLNVSDHRCWAKPGVGALRKFYKMYAKFISQHFVH